jgi:hypothetical protein
VTRARWAWAGHKAPCRVARERSISALARIRVTETLPRQSSLRRTTGQIELPLSAAF